MRISKSKRIFGMTQTQVIILSVMACFNCFVIVGFVWLLVFDIYPLVKVKPLYPIQIPTPSLTFIPQSTTTIPNPSPTPSLTFLPQSTITSIPNPSPTPSKVSHTITPTFTQVMSVVPTITIPPSVGTRLLKYYAVDWVSDNADFAKLAGWGIDTAIVMFDINIKVATWRAAFEAAAQAGINIVIAPSDWIAPRANCSNDFPYPVSTNGDITKVEPLLDVASDYPNFIGIVNASEPLSNCPMTFDEMAGLKDQLKDYALSKGRTIKVWNYIDNLYTESRLPAAQIARIMDIAVTWTHCAGDAEGSCDVGSNSALAKIISDRARLTAVGLNGQVELVYLMQTFTTSAPYTTRFTLAQLETYGCEFLSTSALDGYVYYTWSATWWPDLSEWLDLQPAIPFVHSSCVGG
jgi:hypothetical protein